MDDSRDIAVITAEPLSLDDLLGRLGHASAGGRGEDEEAGALVTFSGIVRAREGAGTIAHLDYEHYEGMAEAETARLVAEARERWPLRRVGVIHRTGVVPVAEASVIVAVSAGHREEAFAAARFLIDELKQRVPIWKIPPRGD